MYIFDINSLSFALFAIIFSHSEGYLFTLLIVSFVVQKHLILIRSHLLIFALISSILGGGSSRILLWFMSESVLPRVFFSRSFIDSSLMFSSFILSLFLCMMLESEFHCFTSGWPVFPAQLIKEIVFSPLYILASFVKDKVSIVRGFISGLSVLFHWSIFLSLCQYHTVLMTVAL